MQATQVEQVQIGESGPATGQLVAGGVEQPGTQGLEHPGAAVGACAATDTEHDGVTALLDGRPPSIPM